MKELSDKYRERGFEIVAVSDEGEAKIAPYVSKHEIGYGVVYAENVLKTYGGKGYPSAWVVGADGKVLWSGHPNSVTGEMVGEWVKDLAPTKVDKELHEDLEDAVKNFNDGEYGKALAEAGKIAEDTEDEAAREDAGYLKELVQKHVDVYTAKMESSREAGELVKLGETLEAAAEAFDGSEIGDKWEDEFKELKRSREYKDTVKAANALDMVREKLGDMHPRSARKHLQRIIDKYPDTPAGKEAAELIKRYEE